MKVELNRDNITVSNQEWEVEYPIVRLPGGSRAVARDFAIVRAGPVRPFTEQESKHFYQMARQAFDQRSK